MVANSDTVDWVTVAAVGTHCKTKWRKVKVLSQQGIDMFLGLSGLREGQSRVAFWRKWHSVHS